MPDDPDRYGTDFLRRGAPDDRLPDERHAARGRDAAASARS